ncbi:MAG: glycosyltransferase [Alphaproteobacteria bacterium]
MLELAPAEPEGTAGHDALPVAGESERAFRDARDFHFVPGRECIVILSPELEQSGAAILALNLCAFLKRRHNVVLLALGGGSLLEGARTAATVVVALSEANRANESARHATAAAAARVFSPLYVIADGVADPSFIAGFAYAGVPTMLLLHDAAGAGTDASAEAVSLVCGLFVPQPLAEPPTGRHGAAVTVLPPAASQIRVPVPAAAAEAERLRLTAAIRTGHEEAFVVLAEGPAGAGIGRFLRIAEQIQRRPGARPIRFAWHLSGGTRDGKAATARPSSSDGVSIAVLDETTETEALLRLADAVMLLPEGDAVPMLAAAALHRGVPVVASGAESWLARLLAADPVLAAGIASDDAAATAIIGRLADADDGCRGRLAEAGSAFAAAHLAMPAYVAAVHRAAITGGNAWRERQRASGAGTAQRWPVLFLPHSGEPVVSIIIPAHGKFELTHACARSIVETRPRTPIEVILVDDCSPDDTQRAPLILRGCTVIRNERNLGFIDSCNAGARAARGSLLFFLNNDTVLHPGALDALVETFADNPRAGIVGGKLLFPDGRLQEAGGIVWRRGDAWNYGRGGDADDPRYNYVRRADYVSGAALMIRRDVFSALDGFDRHFAPAYYEDTDIAFRARAAGWQVLYQPRARITHIEGATAGTDLQSGMKRYQALNRQRFQERWQATLEGHSATGTAPDLEKDREAAFRVLFIDETTPTPKEDAGSMAAVTHMRCLASLGGKITFVPADNMSHLGGTSVALQDQGVEFLHFPHFWSVEEVLRKRRDEFDVIYLHRLNIAARYLFLCRALAPRARLVYNVADLHHLRLERGRDVGAAERPSEDTIRDARDMELLFARSADRVIVHSSVERRLLESRGIAHVVEVPWVIEGETGPLSPSERAGICFVGGFRHRPNLDAVTWFVDEVWPHVLARRPSEIFHIAGSNMPTAAWALERHPGVRCLGYVEDLSALLAKVRLTVAPLRYGAGLKGKIGVSFAHGVPCVATRIGYEGFDDPDPDLLQVADDPEAMASRIVTLLADDDAWRRAAAAAMRYAEANFSEAAVARRLAAILPAREQATKEANGYDG